MLDRVKDAIKVGPPGPVCIANVALSYLDSRVMLFLGRVTYATAVS